MFVQFDTDPVPPGREHPWTASTANPEWKYHDFKQHLDLIPFVLEDYKPLETYPAIQTFYDLLRWLHGPGSNFETNDCALGAPRTDPNPPDVIPPDCRTVIHGRVTVLFRNLRHNTTAVGIKWLKQTIYDKLRCEVPNFPAVVFVGEWPHFFTAIERPGSVVLLRFWAWGTDDQHAMVNLKSLFEILGQLFKVISSAVLYPSA